ncbi:DNA-binding transcriptional LysR family regulator [Actinomycetospora succinea]|uniref:DNA-binding transcriptional LysR family regulator n=1 Tax=Actinomycetospora succinea TaxID=663603 RepID=A0A4R6VT78_9PSEU|nr:LysR family transcriptional regulator [Actinomycetospora succinea]TDQ65720.1 DNA-binding transcriptional LysR family regulator [Actinomycetospora succinea]
MDEAPPLRLANLDLNLLLSLRALLTERNVTRAAAALGLSQPAVSAALARLRRHFGDELLVRVGNRYELTPLAARLIDRTEAAVAGIERVFSAAPDFDPAATTREFTLLVSDYATSVLGPPLAAAFARTAPRARLRLCPHRPEDVTGAAERLRAVDGLLLPHGFVDDMPYLDLYEDHWVVLVATTNDRVGETVTLDDLAALPWVTVYHRPTAFIPAAQQLRAHGIEPRAQVVVESFLPIPDLVAGTDRVGLLQGRLAARLRPDDGVRVLPCPFTATPLVEAMWWHPTYDADPAHRWLRGLLTEVGADLPAISAADGDPQQE